MAATGPANSEQEARNSWVSAYPFEPYGNGQGVLIAAVSSAATQGTLPGPSGGTAPILNSILINNMSSYWMSVQWGTSSVVATTASLAVPPGAAALFSLTTSGQATPTTISVIGQGGSGNVQAILGYGGN